MYNCSIQDFSTKEFVSLKKENSILYTWSWNTDISRELIDRQLEEFKNAGIGGIYILPLPENFRPSTMKSYLKPDYLSEDFFRLVKYAVEKGNEMGMLTWIYDEGGWPSGGACGQTAKENSKAAETILEKRELVLKKGEKLTFKNNTVAVFLGKERLFEGFLAEEDIVFDEYYTKKCDDCHPNRVDSTNKDVIDTFINNTYEKYKTGLGDAFEKVPAVFTDEPSVIYSLLPENIFDSFEEKYGYDMREYLYCIHNRELAESPKECQARIDFGRLIGDLFYENFCKNIGDWCKKNNKLFAGHLDLDHLADGASHQCYFSHLHALRCFDIPGVDVIWHQIRMPKAGEMPVPEGVPFFPRLASSAAHQEGNNLALTESFGVYGDALTPDEFRYVLNYQAMRGINVFNVMLTTSGFSKSLSMVERPVFSPKKPGFYNLGHINTYFARLSYLLRLGEPMIETGLYNPCADYWANPKYAKTAKDSYAECGNALEKANVEFDVVDDYVICDAEATDVGLKIGNVCYKKIVVPKCSFMPDEVKSKLSPYLADIEDIGIDKESQLMVMKRKLPSGILCFVFNEKRATVCEKLDISLEKLYKLNLISGEITKTKTAEVSLACGDMAVFYETDASLKTVSEDAEYTVEADGFEAVFAKQFVVTKDGISMQEVDIPEIDDRFSGEITYRGCYELRDNPSPDDRFKIVISDTDVSARVLLDGKLVGTAGFSPMEITVSGENLKKRGIIEVVVANTAANEIVAKNDLIMSIPAEDRGPYHEKSVEFEKGAPCIRFGKVEILKYR